MCAYTYIHTYVANYVHMYIGFVLLFYGHISNIKIIVKSSTGFKNVFIYIHSYGVAVNVYNARKLQYPYRL